MSQSEQQTSPYFQVRSTKEMKLNLPKWWLTLFSIIYLIVGFSIAIFEVLAIYNGLHNSGHAQYEILPIRFGYSTALILTGIFCVMLMSSPKKKASNFFCFLFAVASLILASMIYAGVVYELAYEFIQHSYDMAPTNALRFLKHAHLLDLNHNGDYYFLGWWTLETLTFQSFQLLIIAVSSAQICICVNLWFKIDLVQECSQPNDSERHSKYLFTIIGGVLIISGFVINVGLILATNIFHIRSDEDFSYAYHFSIPFVCLSLYFSGLLCLSIASYYR